MQKAVDDSNLVFCSPNMLAVQSDLPTKKGVKEYFAVEDLIIMPDQRVPIEKTHTELSQMIIKVLLFEVLVVSLFS